jgi:hypothetical protein
VIDSKQLADFITVTPVLFHITAATNISQIQRQGLLPGSEIGEVTCNDFFRTRPGHVYLIGCEEIPIVEIEGEPRVLAVDLTALAPELIDPDEDMVAERFPELVAVSPPQREMNGAVEAQGQVGALARWAEETPGFDRSEVTARSLECKRIAYRGAIAPGALTLFDKPSPVLACLKSALRSEVAASLPPTPHWGGWRSEVLRARVVVRLAVVGTLRAVGAHADVGVGDPEEARATFERVRPVIRTLLQEGRAAEADAVSVAQRAVEAVIDLEELAPISGEKSATVVACAAAAAVNAFVPVPQLGINRARELAVSVFSIALDASACAIRRH